MAQAWKLPDANALNDPVGAAPMAPPQQASVPLDFSPQLNWSPALTDSQLPAGTLVAPLPL